MEERDFFCFALCSSENRLRHGDAELGIHGIVVVPGEVVICGELISWEAGQLVETAEGRGVIQLALGRKDIAGRTDHMQRTIVDPSVIEARCFSRCQRVTVDQRVVRPVDTDGRGQPSHVADAQLGVQIDIIIDRIPVFLDQLIGWEPGDLRVAFAAIQHTDGGENVAG